MFKNLAEKATVSRGAELYLETEGSNPKLICKQTLPKPKVKWVAWN